MKHIITNLIFLLIITLSCNTTQNDTDKSVNGRSSTNQEKKLSQSNSSDTTKILKVVAKDILERLKGQHIRKSGFDENGDFYLEFNEDTTNAEPDDIIWEFYQIDKDEIVTGELNADNKLDFAILSVWGPTMGNMYGLEWHIYVSDNDKYNRIENDFGGGKFSDMEIVAAIDKMKLITEFQEYDEETAWLKDSVELREYQLTEKELKRIK